MFKNRRASWIFTFTLAEDEGKVAWTKISNAEGGISRSPFLTAPFTKTGRALGVDKILPVNRKK